MSPAEFSARGSSRFLLASVRPGITGLWQVERRADMDAASRILLDNFYARNHSFRLDAKIIALTPVAVLSRRGRVAQWRTCDGAILRASQRSDALKGILRSVSLLAGAPLGQLLLSPPPPVAASTPRRVGPPRLRFHRSVLVVVACLRSKPHRPPSDDETPSLTMLSSPLLLASHCSRTVVLVAANRSRSCSAPGRVAWLLPA